MAGLNPDEATRRDCLARRHANRLNRLKQENRRR